MVQEVYQEILLIVLFLDSEVFDNFILAAELFAKALQSLETGLSVNIN